MIILLSLWATQLLFLWNSHTASAWVGVWRTAPCRSTRTSSTTWTCLQMNSGSNKDSGDDSRRSSSPVLERAKVAGVSVSPNGFHVLLQRTTTSATAGTSRTSSSDGSSYVPLKVTNDPADAVAATSPESLTLCQLLSGVDMAGAILPPELLSKLVVYHIEEKMGHDEDSDDDTAVALSPQEQKIYDAIQESLPDKQETYKDAHVWFQNRIRLPQVTLDQLTLIPNNNNGNQHAWTCRLECALPEWKDRVVVDVVPEVLASLAFQYDPETSLMFTCVALALRYKAPIVLEQLEDDGPPNHIPIMSRQDLDKAFPQRTTVGKLKQQSTRVAENIERGFEIHKLQGALTIAMRMGDEKAVERIRAKLDEYDSMHDLPTTPTTTNIAVDDEQDDNNNEGRDGRLDDLDNNILQ